MCKKKETIHYRDIGSTSAKELLSLSEEELDSFIYVAQGRIREARSIIQWIHGIKLEKALREDAAGPELGKPKGESS